MHRANMRIYDTLELTSDFFESSLPLTYDYFIRKGLYKKYGNKDGNSFDLFIKKNIPFFAFVIDQFYKNKKPRYLRLAELSDDKMLHHLDKAILEYICKGGQYRLNAIRELYIYLLESWVIKLAVNIAP